MSLFQTPTPPYQQNQAQPHTPTGVLGWLARLLRTPTPAYKGLPSLQNPDSEPPSVE